MALLALAMKIDESDQPGGQLEHMYAFNPSTKKVEASESLCEGQQDYMVTSGQAKTAE